MISLLARWLSTRVEPISATIARKAYASPDDPQIDPAAVIKLRKRAYAAIKRAMTNSRSVEVRYATSPIYDDDEDADQCVVYAKASKLGELAAADLRNYGYTVAVKRRIVVYAAEGVEGEANEEYEYYLHISWADSTEAQS